MKINDLIQSSRQSLQRTRGRSFLTMLGIVIGIMSVIVMLSIGEAAQRYILSQISSMGSDIIKVVNGPSVDSGQPSLFAQESLTIKDVKKLKTAAWVTHVVGRLRQEDQFTANGFTTNVTVLGTMPDEIYLEDIDVRVGSFLSLASIDSRAREVVLGYEVAQKAFGQDDPIGKIVKFSGQGFKVIGVMEQVGTKSFENRDRYMYIPVTSSLDLYGRQYVQDITLKSSVGMSEAIRRLTILLRDQHSIDNPDDSPMKDDFHIHTQQDFVRYANQITQILQILLVSIAAISLLVGGIGIMNIMYVTVTERIKEIGLRKAIGATRMDILQQFILEAVILTGLGGICGIILGSGLSWIAIRVISSFQAGWTFAVSMRGVVLGFGVSVAIGLVFGYFPARKAARLSPIDALRVE